MTKEEEEKKEEERSEIVVVVERIEEGRAKYLRSLCILDARKQNPQPFEK